MLKWAISRSAFMRLALVVFLASCGEGIPRLPALGQNDLIVAFGDSLTYGTGAAPDESYPEVLSKLIGRPVVGSGVPGEQTSGGLARLQDALEEHRPKILLLCLGGNDMLRKVDASVTESNLRQMVLSARAQGVSVVLIGVPIPALFGGSAEFYERIADDLGLPLENEVLSDILKDNSLKSDAIHPNAHGYRRMAESVAELLRKTGAL